MKNLLTSIITLVLSLGLFAALLLQTPTFAASPAFSIIPNSTTSNINEIFSINIRLDTGGSRSSGADMIFGYNSEILELQNINYGSLYSQYINNSSSGQVNLSAISFPPDDFQGVGTFATVTFKGLKNGKSDLRLQFLPGSSTDSNISNMAGVDILSRVINGSITIGPVVSDPTPPEVIPEPDPIPEPVVVPEPIAVPETCNDGIQNQDESNIDCGGICGGFWYNRTCNQEIKTVALNIPKAKKPDPIPEPVIVPEPLPTPKSEPVKVIVIEAPEIITDIAEKVTHPAPTLEKTPKKEEIIPETPETKSDEIFVLQSIEAPSGYYYFPETTSDGKAQYIGTEKSWVIVLTPPISYYLLGAGIFTLFFFILLIFLLLKISYLKGQLTGQRLSLELLDEIKHMRTITADDRDGEILAEDLEKILIQNTASELHAANPFEPKKD